MDDEDEAWVGRGLGRMLLFEESRVRLPAAEDVEAGLVALFWARAAAPVWIGEMGLLCAPFAVVSGAGFAPADPRRFDAALTAVLCPAAFGSLSEMPPRRAASTSAGSSSSLASSQVSSSSSAPPVALRVNPGRVLLIRLEVDAVEARLVVCEWSAEYVRDGMPRLTALFCKLPEGMRRACRDAAACPEPAVAPAAAKVVVSDARRESGTPARSAGGEVGLLCPHSGMALLRRACSGARLAWNEGANWMTLLHRRGSVGGEPSRPLSPSRA